MASVLRNVPLLGTDLTVTPTGSGPDIFFDHGNGFITVYSQIAIEGANTIFGPVRQEPKAIGVTYGADILDTGA